MSKKDAVDGAKLVVPIPGVLFGAGAKLRSKEGTVAKV